VTHLHNIYFKGAAKMDAQTSTEQVRDNRIVPPTVLATDESLLTPELVERVRKLAPAEQLRLRDLIDDGEPDGTPEELRKAWHEEIQRRLDAITRGEMKMYTVEETMSYLRSRTWRGERA
jgi:putative addiction module component (TIGR02574 family)